jgi:hypothetical protein
VYDVPAGVQRVRVLNEAAQVRVEVQYQGDELVVVMTWPGRKPFNPHEVQAADA